MRCGTQWPLISASTPGKVGNGQEPIIGESPTSLPEEYTAMPYSGFEPEPTQIQADGHIHPTGRACSQVQHSTQQNNLEFNLNHFSMSFAARQISQNYAQKSSDPPSLSPELSSFPFSIGVLDPYFNTNQKSVPVECSQMEYCYNEMKPQVKAKEETVKLSHELKPTMYRISSPS
ncbi:uncharacterized protein TNCV_1377331 [Trichonephila clavipes]|nr:uncharacterized protein TNCV_1377331 [Trichonephila clavipes]